MQVRGLYGVARLLVHAGLLMSLAGAAEAAPKPVRILAFGDSLTAGYGLQAGQGFVPQLQDTLRRNGVAAFVTNGGVSGDTAGAARARLGWVLSGMKETPDLAIVALGGNDMLRGIAPARTRADMDAILGELSKRGIPIVVAGMLSAPNLGPAYVRDFNAIFPDLARKYHAPLYPFFLAGVAGNSRLSLPDRVHPNFEGIKRMVTGIAPTVLKALGK